MKQPISDTRDGFQLMRDQFNVPKDTSDLDLKTKRAVTICNLFLNHKLGLRDIVRLLDEERRSVVLSLLEQGIIHERRSRPMEALDGKERRRSIVSP